MPLYIAYQSGLPPDYGACSAPFNVQFIRIQQQSDQRHLIIRLISDIADYDHPWMTVKLIDMLLSDSLAQKPAPDP
jgi:hypothetical protein